MRKVENTRARKRLDAIRQQLEELKQHIEVVRLNVGNALIHEQLTTVEDWQLWNGRAHDIECESESLCRYLRWQGHNKNSGATR